MLQVEVQANTACCGNIEVETYDEDAKAAIEGTCPECGSEPDVHSTVRFTVRR